jgi:drug/metabolite transporter (DMT)-like permease
MLIAVSLPRLPAALTSLLLIIQPVATVGLAAAIFGESPTALQLAGVLVVVAAVFVATSRASALIASPKQTGSKLTRRSPGGSVPAED